MRNLTLGDLSLALRDLFENRQADLDLSQSGKLYGPMLALKRTAIDALPTAAAGGEPLAAELSVTDDVHDGFGAALFSYTEAVGRSPDSTPEQRVAAQRIRDAFIPNKGALQDSYADEAAAAKKARPLLVEREKDLKSFPVPNGTLYDWAKGFLDAGDKLDKLLSDRASLQADARGGGTAGLLRSQTLGILSRFRNALADEMLVNVGLPRNLDARVFGYLDDLSARRRASKSRNEATGDAT